MQFFIRYFFLSKQNENHKFPLLISPEMAIFLQFPKIFSQTLKPKSCETHIQSFPRTEQNSRNMEQQRKKKSVWKNPYLVWRVSLDLHGASREECCSTAIAVSAAAVGLRVWRIRLRLLGVRCSSHVSQHSSEPATKKASLSYSLDRVTGVRHPFLFISVQCCKKQWS